MSQACRCPSCRAECKRVSGWFTPAEAEKAIKTGLASRLVFVEEEQTGIAPAGTEFPNHGRCTFLLLDERCELHGRDYKPIECRTGFGCDRRDPAAPTVQDMYELWASAEGSKVRQMLKEAQNALR